MLKYIYIFISFLVLVSCKNKIEKVVNKVERIENEVKINIRNGSMGYTTNCYQHVKMEDTISLVLDRPDQNRISGALHYKFAHKENYSGVLTGFVNGDTIFADYTMMQNGIRKVQEVVFLNKGDYYIQGFGVMDSIPGKITFVKGAPIRFDQSTKLEITDCP